MPKHLRALENMDEEFIWNFVGIVYAEIQRRNWPGKKKAFDFLKRMLWEYRDVISVRSTTDKSEKTKGTIGAGSLIDKVRKGKTMRAVVSSDIKHLLMICLRFSSVWYGAKLYKTTTTKFAEVAAERFNIHNKTKRKKDFSDHDMIQPDRFPLSVDMTERGVVKTKSALKEIKEERL